MEKQITNDELSRRVSESINTHNSLSLNFSLSFAKRLVSIDWIFTYYAYLYEYFDESQVIEYALSFLEEHLDDSAALEIALLHNEKIIIREELINLIQKETGKISSEGERTAQKEIQYVLLYALYLDRQRYEDVFSALEIIYDDFGFPSDMENFIRYMSDGANEKELEIWWEVYLFGLILIPENFGVSLFLSKEKEFKTLNQLTQKIFVEGVFCCKAHVYGTRKELKKLESRLREKSWNEFILKRKTLLDKSSMIFSVNSKRLADLSAVLLLLLESKADGWEMHLTGSLQKWLVIRTRKTVSGKQYYLFSAPKEEINLLTDEKVLKKGGEEHAYGNNCTS